MSTLDESYFIGEWYVEPLLHRISKNGESKKVEPQLMAVLQQLAQNPGQVVTKEDLKNTVWVDVIVTENVLTRAISSLRKLLEDDRTEPTYIETISKTGYRLVAKVKHSKKAKKSDETITIKLSRKPVVTVIGIVVLLALGAFATRRIFLPITPLNVYHPNAIASYSNSEYWPAISPDGRFVAYAWKGESDNNWDIYAKQIGTETIVRITENSSTELRPRWSPDGNYVYYLRYENGGSTIYKKPILGGEEIRILAAPQYCSGDFDVSPDERWISFNDRENESGPLRIILISLENGERKVLTQPETGFNGDIHPTFSPEGRKLAFIREKNSVSMYLWHIDLRTEKLEPLTTAHISINGFDWSSDGNSLFYGSDRSGLYKLWELNIDSKESTLVPATDYQMVMPRVAENGRIIYAKMRDNVNVWSYQLKSKTAKAWLANNELSLNPSISPKGDKACFTMSKDGVFQLWVSNTDGTKAVPITRFAGQYLTSPTWSPNGESIVFQGFQDGQADIYTVNALGGIPENLTNSDKDEHTPHFSKTGEIYYSSNRNNEWSIWKMKADGSNKVKVVDGNAYAPRLSEDENKIYYVKKGDIGLWEYDREMETEKLVIGPFHPMYWGAFAVSKNGIYFFNPDDKSIQFFDFELKESDLIYRPQGRIPRLGVTLHLSPNEEQLLFSQIDHNDADIMLLEELQ